VADAELTSAAAAVSITVNPVNDAPQAIAQAVGTAEDTAIEISLSGSDVENDPLTYAIASQPANGTVTLNGAVATFTPNANSNGPDSFTFTVADAGFTSAPAAVSVTVNSVNDAPLAIAQAVSTAEDTAIEITVSGSDVDGDLLTYAIASQPANGTVTLNGALATYTPNLNSNGPDSFTFTVADAGFTSAPAAVSVTVNPVNDAPQAIAQAVSTAEDTALEITLSGSDVENDSLTYAIASQPSNGTVTLNGAVATYTPNANGNGPDSFTFTVADAGFTSAPASVSLTVNPVNDTPVAVADTLEATEDTPATYPVSALLGNDTDIENDSLNVASVTGATLNGDNTITFTPAGNFNGVAGFTYTVTDGNTTSAPAVVTVNVAAVNDAPVATAGSAIVNEDGTVVIALVGTDVDGDTLTYSIVTQPANGIASVSGSNATYQPHPDLNGTDSFTFKAYDGQFDSAPATITVTVTPVDDVPVANPQSVATDEDTQKVITLTGSDVDGDVLFYTVPGTPSHGTLSLSGAQATYTPNPDYHGPDSFTFFTYSIVGGLPVFSAPATVAITVNPVNDTPVALTGSATTDEDAAVLVSLAGTDVDGNPLSYAIATQPSGGSVSLSGNQAGYTPNGNFNGTDSFTFTVNDGSATSVPATVTITVNPINDTPQAVADTRVTDENTPLEVNAPGVLANDSDVENSSLSTQLVTDVSNGTLALAANGGFTYTPASGFSGTDSFSYRVSDGELTSDAVTVTITVNDTASDFDNWLDGFGLTAWPDEDSDGDSISNAVEYVIGGNPANQVDTGLLPTVQTISANLDALPGDEDYLLFTYRRTDLAQADPQTTIGVQWNPLLTGEWAAADGSHGEVIVVEDVPGQDYDLVKVHIPRALAANGRLFARLSVATVSEGPTE
jgi:aspartate 1-decarboxylase